MIIAIEGIDGSGKGTQARLLREHLATKFERAELLSFPRYKQSRGARLVEMYLNGAFGQGAQESYLGPAMCYALDRFEAREELMRYAANPDDVLVVDRYVASNLAHQSCKQVQEHARREAQDHIFMIEHDVLGLPLPDVTVYLNISSELSHARVAQKGARAYTQATHDIHEANSDHLTLARRAFQEVFERGMYQGVLSVDVSEGSTIQEIQHEIARQLEQREGAARP